MKYDFMHLFNGSNLNYVEKICVNKRCRLIYRRNLSLNYSTHITYIYTRIPIDFYDNIRNL